MSNIPSVIKWTGSKRKQANKIMELAPDYDRYIEPFLGGGSMLFLASGKKQEICGDIYSPLIDLWLLIQNSPDKLVEHYDNLWHLLQEELKILRNNPSSQKTNKQPSVYYEVRDRFNLRPNPLDLNFILRTCVNGIVRFNDKGEFNNSFHLSRNGMKPSTFKNNVQIWSDKIQNTIFVNQDYEETINLANKKDFIYLDPPYLNSSNRYINNLDSERLLKNLEDLNQKGIKWALSFDGSRGDTVYDHCIPRDLYVHKYDISNGISTMNNTLSKKKEYVMESLYTNY